MEVERRGSAWALLGTSGVSTLLESSVAARLPLAMFSIALLVHTRRLTGSFAAAGLVTGAYAAAEGIGSPLLARIVDRRGQTVVLLSSASITAGLLCILALLPPASPTALLLLLAALVGLATPPVGACARSLLPRLLRGDALRTAYAVESSALELTFIVGPPLALGLGAISSTGAALAAGGILLLLATVVFALQPPSRSWKPDRHDRPRRGSLSSDGLRTLVLVLGAVGIVFGAVEVGVTAAASPLGGTAAAGPLLAVWGVGSLAGGIAASRLGGGARSSRGLVVFLVALTLGHLAVGLGLGNAYLLAALLFLAGATIAPTYASVYAMVEDVAPAGSITEAFAWLATAISVGAAGGAAAAGSLTQSMGPYATFLLAGSAGALAVVLLVMGGVTLATGGTVEAGERAPTARERGCVAPASS
jgi:MFS family permease